MRRTCSPPSVERRGETILFELTANAFLHHMVRNLVGSLVYVGKGAAPPEWLAEVLALRDRTRAAATFGPEGLYLAAVEYRAMEAAGVRLYASGLPGGR